MKALAAVIMMACTGCMVSKALPEAAVIACAKDADCPTTPALVCRLRTGRCVQPGLVEDFEPPQLVSVTPSDAQHVVLVFNEALDAEAAQTTAAYTITPPLPVLASETNAEGSIVTLLTTTQVFGERYTLTLSGLRDRDTNAMSDGTTAPFLGFGSVADPEPPVLVAPNDGAAIFGGHTILRWSRRVLASSYTVDVATDSAFTAPITGSPFTVLDPTTQLEVALPDAVTTYWRVRADVTRGDEHSAVGHFETMGDRIYVYCPPGPCDDADAVGNKSHPFRTIVRGMAEAVSAGVDRVDIAGRGGTAYAEQVLVSSGISLYGGYTPAFDEADRTSDTLISSGGTFTVGAVNIFVPTTLDTLHIHSTGTLFSLWVLASSNAVTVSNCYLTGARFPMWLQTSGETPDTAPLIIGNTFSDGLPGSNGQLALDESSARIIGNTIGTDTSPTNGVYLSGAHNALFEDNTISAGGGFVGVLGDGIDTPRFNGNHIRGGIWGKTGQAEAWVVTNNVISGTTPLRINALGIVTNNTIFSESASATTQAVQITRPSRVTNNIIFNTPATGICLRITTAARLLSFQSNLLFGCATLLALDSGGTPGCGSGYTCYDASVLNDATIIGISGGPAAAVSDNVTAVDLASQAFAAFPTDLHLTASTPDATTKSGKRVDTAKCGSNQNLSCGEVSEDKEGHLRTCPTTGSDCVSLGAYERD